MQAVAPAMRGPELHAASPRGRNRAASDAYQQPVPERDPVPGQLPKAASYTYFPRVKDLMDEPVLELKGKISEEDLKPVSNRDGSSSSSSSGGSSPVSEESPQVEHMPQMKPSSVRRSSSLLPFSSKSSTKSSKSRDSSAEPKPKTTSTPTSTPTSTSTPAPAPPARSHTDSSKQSDSSATSSPVRSLTRLRRKSWVGGAQSSHSRSSSPSKEKEPLASVKENEPRKSLGAEASKRKSLTSALSIPEKPAKNSMDSPGTPKGRLLTKKSKRLSGFFGATSPQDSTPAEANAPPVPPVPPMPAVPKSFSTDRLPSFFEKSPTSPTHIPPLPRNLSPDKIKNTKTEVRKKDELWTVFRTLEGDYRKFQSKSSALKANVVRTTLLSFLRHYASHPSNLKLRPEDLDRRANILNSWWTGLLELLAGRNNQSVSGTDRPAILEGIAGIMERPEWRQSPSPFCALVDRDETCSTTTAKSTGSASSESSDFLAESVYHNVRNIFTQNLLSQMTFVVDKMALRNAAASLVTFSGKTCAYAFCFCPGVADILVRLWNPSLDTMKRVLAESGVSRQDQLDPVSDRVIANFPPTLQSLKFQSLTKMVRSLRHPTTPPLGTANVDWYGMWGKRWSGAESDLFYVFVKHYHILMADFLPGEPSDAERVCAPGLIMVHAQILVNMDATINRHAAPQQLDDGSASITFDDVLGDPDTSASTLPIPPANATRQMAENRLVMLIRDFLSERNAHLSTARRTFAEGFVRLLKAAAQRVSVYDNNACYTLCDFLEESLVILVRYEHSDPPHTVLDWPFWLSVCKSMAASQNTATEIKLFSFLYSSWSNLTSSEERKSSLCLDFLLEPEFFESRFNHWCPMVRSYFMRLLCWRVARFDGVESEAEIKIISTLSDRLRSVWAHYLWLRDDAERKQTMPPSTQACNPAPGRRFLIIRNDNPIVTNAGPFLSFDGVVQNPSARRLSSTTNTAPEIPERPTSAASTDSNDFPDEHNEKGRWSMLRSLIGVPKQSSKSRSPGPSRKEKEKEKKEEKEKEKENAKAAASNNSTKPNSVDSASTTKTETPPPSAASAHRSYSFRFSLEWVDRRLGVYQNMRLSPPRLPLAAQMLLQTKGINNTPVVETPPVGDAWTSSRYSGRALAEWTFISHECQNFFDRRKNEGVPSNKQVETPTLAVEAFRRPG